MTDEEYKAKLNKLELENEKDREKLLEQIELRDELITRLINESGEDLCQDCALKSICPNGAKAETCAAGLILSTAKKQERDVAEDEARFYNNAPEVKA